MISEKLVFFACQNKSAFLCHPDFAPNLTLLWSALAKERRKLSYLRCFLKGSFPALHFYWTVGDTSSSARHINGAVKHRELVVLSDSRISGPTF